MTPTLTTSRLTLVPYTAGMVTVRHVEWLNDKEVVKYSEQRHKEHTLESQHKYLNEFPYGSRIWIITTDPVAYFGTIGTITAYIDRPNRRANMGIMIGEKSAWGQGYGSEAWDAVIEYLFTDENIRKIECGCMLSNEPMMVLAKRSGMTMETVVPEHFSFNDRPEALVTWGLMWYNMYHDRQGERVLGQSGNQP